MTKKCENRGNIKVYLLAGGVRFNGEISKYIWVIIYQVMQTLFVNAN